jgi:uncharacterized membrane protein
VLSLASFRSPFVPDAYGLVGTLWLLTLIAAERQRLIEWTALVIAGAAFSLVFDGGLVPSPVPLWMVLATLGIQLAAYGINLFVVLTPHRAARLVPELEPRREAVTVHRRARRGRRDIQDFLVRISALFAISAVNT